MWTITRTRARHRVAVRGRSHKTHRQLRYELDDSFRNDLEKIKDNKLERVTDQLREIESGKNKRMTTSILTMLQASVEGIRQEFHQHITEENNSLKSKIIDRHTQILKLKSEFQDSQKELHHTLQDLEA